jgi:predicted Zn-dependent protease
MDNTYSGVYYTDSGQRYTVTLFFSAVTITIRYLDEVSQEKDIYWLTKDLTTLNEQATSTELIYANKSGKTERLIIQDALAVQTLKKYLRYHPLVIKGPRRIILGNVWTKLLLFFVIAIALLLAAYLWWIPMLGERMANHFSKETEISMGEQMYKSTIATYKTDVPKTAAVNAFFQQLHYNIDYPVQVTVVESGETNAFAIPGGHIVVYDAILERMKTPEELAALLAHEASHVALRHSLKNMFRSLSRKMFLALVTGNQSGIVSVAVDNADELKGLSYSRALETEADDNGLQLMAKSHVNTEGMLWLMQLLQKESGGTGEPTAILSTHPVFKERIANIKKQLQQLPVETTQDEELKKLFHAIYE